MEGAPKFNSGDEFKKTEEISTSEEARLARLAEGNEVVYGMAERERTEMEVTPEKIETQKLETKVERELTPTEKEKIFYFNKEEKLTLYRLLRGKGESAEKVPAGFELPSEIKENAFDFFKARFRYVEEWHKHSQTLKALEKSGGKEGDVEYIDAKRYLENADTTYKLALERLKRDVVGYKYREKIKEFPEAAAKIGKKKEYAAASASVMVGIAKFVNGDLEKMKMERMSRENEREKSGMRKLWEKYTGLSRGKRLLMSAGLSAGIGAGVAFALGPGGWLIAAGVAGHRGLRTLGGGAIAAGLNSLGRKIFGSKFGKERGENLTGETLAVQQEILAEIETQRNLSKKEKNKWRMMEIVDEHADKYGDKLKDIARRERKTNMVVALASGLVGGLTAAGLDWYFSKPKISEIVLKSKEPPLTSSSAPGEIPAEKIPGIIPGKTGVMAGIMEKLPIGKRGPEGAIIDYFKSNPEAAKKFGWDGIRDVKDWAGVKAHSLWLEDAQEALKNPEIVNKLKSLGYSQDMDGYGQMMRRIGKGFVEIDPRTGKINLADTDYLKAVKETGVEQVESTVVPKEIPSVGEVSQPEVVITPESGEIPPAEVIPETKISTEIKDIGGIKPKVLSMAEEDIGVKAMEKLKTSTGLTEEQINKYPELIDQLKRKVGIDFKIAFEKMRLPLSDAIDFKVENLQQIMDSSEGKMDGIFFKLGVSAEKFADNLNKIFPVGENKLGQLMNMDAYELYQQAMRQQSGPLIDFSMKLRELSGYGTEYLKNNQITVQNLIEAIPSSKVFGGTAVEVLEKASKS